MFCISIKTQDYVISPYRVHLSKTTKHWDGFVSHCIALCSSVIALGILENRVGMAERVIALGILENRVGMAERGLPRLLGGVHQQILEIMVDAVDAVDVIDTS